MVDSEDHPWPGSRSVSAPTRPFLLGPWSSGVVLLRKGLLRDTRMASESDESRELSVVRIVDVFT